MVIRIIFINTIVFLALGLINVIFYLGDNLQLTDGLIDYVGVSANIHQLLFKPWTLITYGFVHQGFMHILFNMLTLFWFGNIFTEYLGNKKFLPLYILGILFGALLYIGIYNLFPVFTNAVVNGYPMIGASAGVLCIVVAAATLLPDYTIFLLLIGPVRLKWLALALIAIDLVSIPFGNAGGHIAHIGGAAFGYFYITQLKIGNDWGKWLSDFFDWCVALFSKSSLKVVSNNSIKNFNTQKSSSVINNSQQEKLDGILDKISKSGYESLNAEEKEYLFSYSKKKN